MNKQKKKTILIILFLIIFILLASNVFVGIRYLDAQEELAKTNISLATQKTSNNVLEFIKLFITKVLKAEGEVSFETRLQLENAVRNLDDQEILFQWQRFVASTAEDEAQIHVKNLLEMLVNKIK